ncbi:MAG TPA: LysM peptidoglycan-binding domain-containing protein [Flavobacterium sp.]|jgi:LysM repeat protein
MRLAGIFLLFLCFCAATSSYAQTASSNGNFIEHHVKPGETVRLISQKYLVTPSTIYKHNKFAIDGISQGMVLLIPVTDKPADKKKPLEAELAELDKIQDSLEEESKVITQPTQETSVATKTEHAAANSEIKNPEHQKDAPSTTHQKTEHKVVKGETLSSLSRKYGVTVSEIQKQNEKILTRGLQIGQVLVIPSTVAGAKAAANPHIADHSIAATVAETPATHQNQHNNIVEHKVEAKETLYSISKKYNVSVDEIKQQNAKSLEHGLQAGQIIKIVLKN